jgi:hypothetical protein
MTALKVSGLVCIAGAFLAGAALIRTSDRVNKHYLEAGPAPGRDVAGAAA